MEKDKMILDTDPEAATFSTNIEGWVSRDGLFFGRDEDSARYRGCTHRNCKDCGQPTPKHLTCCDSCAKNRAIARHEKRAVAVWDGKGPLYSDAADCYFDSWEEVEDHILEYPGESLASLRLLICEPVRLRQVESDYWEDSLPEEGDLPEDVATALDKLNEALFNAGPISWQPGKKAACLAGRST